MNIAGVLCIKDELDIVEPFVRHTQLIRSYERWAQPMAVAGEPFNGQFVDEPIEYLGGPLRYTAAPGGELARAAKTLLVLAESMALAHAARSEELEAVRGEFEESKAAAQTEREQLQAALDVMASSSAEDAPARF